MGSLIMPDVGLGKDWCMGKEEDAGGTLAGQAGEGDKELEGWRGLLSNWWLPGRQH